MANNKELFDLWADGYDESVNISEENNEYPFAGYKNLLNKIYNYVRKQDNAKVLDIGFGTGILTSQLYNNGCKITGIDFSEKMIKIAQKKMPGANLINFNFADGIPHKIINEKFDFIISTYAFHHVSNEKKIRLINLYSNLLSKEGSILIGDVSFESKYELEKCKNECYPNWDDSEYYFISREMNESLKDDFYCEYKKISYCAGILILKNR